MAVAYSRTDTSFGRRRNCSMPKCRCVRRAVHMLRIVRRTYTAHREKDEHMHVIERNRFRAFAYPSSSFPPTCVFVRGSAGARMVRSPNDARVRKQHEDGSATFLPHETGNFAPGPSLGNEVASAYEQPTGNERFHDATTRDRLMQHTILTMQPALIHGHAPANDARSHILASTSTLNARVAGTAVKSSSRN